MIKRIRISRKVARHVGNQFYIIIEDDDPLSDESDKIKFFSTWFHKVVDHEPYKKFLNNLDEYAANSSYRYIYKSTENLKLFDPRIEKEWDYLLQTGIVSSQEFQNRTDKVPTLRNMIENWDSEVGGLTKVPYWFKRSCDRSSFMKDFDGIYTVSGRDYLPFVREDIIQKTFDLIDGTAERFAPESPLEEEIEFPEFVIDELNHYTAVSNHKMDSEVVDWLNHNFPLSYSSKILYRGISFSSHDLGERISKSSVDDVESLIQSSMGLNNITDIQEGQKIVASRGKESSWSTDPEISRGFASGVHSGIMNFLLKAKVSSDDVLIDFTQVPLQQRKQFDHWAQNEVIVKDENIAAEINSFQIPDYFAKTIEEWGYRVTNDGIEKI
jgi:hypothetical protein